MKPDLVARTRHSLLKTALSTLQVATLGSVALLSGCTAPSNTDALQQHTADATAAAKRDAGAIARGVVEGLRRKGPLDLNKVSRAQLIDLPGITAERADAIIAGRPYTDPAQLVRKRILTKPELAKIRNQVIASN